MINPQYPEFSTVTAGGFNVKGNKSDGTKGTINITTKDNSALQYYDMIGAMRTIQT
jgi:hypothetical protein